jgi:hypothetical protein
METIRQRRPIDDYGQESVRSATFWDSPLGGLLSSLLPQSHLSVSSPEDSVTDTMDTRFKRWADKGREEADSLGIGASPGLGVAGPVLFADRPWIRDFIAQFAGKKWGTKFAEDIPKPSNIVARDAFEDYLNKVGSDPKEMGLEWEVRSKVPATWQEHKEIRKEAGLPAPSQFWQDIVPPDWRLKTEIFGRAPKEALPYRYNGELVSKSPLEGWDQISDWLTTEGNRLMDPHKSGNPVILGGRYGGGGHIHLGAGGTDEWNPELMKKLFIEYLKAEPWISPPVPATKTSPARKYVPNSLDMLRHGLHRPAFAERLSTADDLDLVMGTLPQKFEGGLSFRSDLSPTRPELRQFYSPKDVGEWGENMLVAQNLLDRASQRKAGLPDTLQGILDEVYNTIEPHSRTIQDIHRNRWYPEGIHEQGSPYARGLAERGYQPQLIPQDRLRALQDLPESELTQEQLNTLWDVTSGEVPTLWNYLQLRDRGMALP